MIEKLLSHRILILDGAMGTAIQAFGLTEEDYRGTEFASWPTQLKGNNDILNITAPNYIKEIHNRYIEAGADIISTNTFNANAISQSEYGCADYVEQINLCGAKLARKCADNYTERKIFVAGSMGPTGKTLSLSPDINRPEFRATDFDTMSSAYYAQAKALIEGGVDMLLLETCFDALNTKAALYAIQKLNSQLKRTIPVMVSVTINDKSGRTLTGATIHAFYTAIKHYPIISFGLNCSFGVTELRPFIEKISESVDCYVSIHPNAGLPNEMGEYDEAPAHTAKHLKDMAEAGLLNIAGGCCGTTFEHIKAIAEALKGVCPRPLKEQPKQLIVSGLESFIIDKEHYNFTNIGERTNVAGSRKFARLISEKSYEEAAQIAAKQIEDGASIIDINMDDSMLNSAEEMERFTRYISNDPQIAKAAVMIDSSDWDTVLAGLKSLQGKCIVNSISLKEGEASFIAKAQELKRFGAAVVVMAFDEEGQATTYNRKIQICQRAYTLLTEEVQFNPEDTIFDVNVLSVATGIEEHANYGVDFIRAVEWIKKNLPGAKTSGGVSNLSFAFRGNNTVREAMHSVFLYHAISAGLDMAIVNPSMLQIYSEIEPSLLKAVEDVILNRTPNATDTLIALAEKIKGEASQGTPTQHMEESDSATVEERLARALCTGKTDTLQADLLKALTESQNNPVTVIEGPLMRGMEQVGTLFGEGKMFLPQVVKSAKVMKQAVEILQPYINAQNSKNESVSRPKAIIATAKGDVHDIGKNIVAIVLECNNFQVIDLGVMVDNQTIIEAVKAENPAIVGISGLITPSLKEMEALCSMMQSEALEIPLIVGGATTSEVHTAVKLAPLYNHAVIYGGDASRTSVIAKRLLTWPAQTIAEIKERQEEVRALYHSKDREEHTLEYATAHAPELTIPTEHPSCSELKSRIPAKPNIEQIAEHIDWLQFMLFWGYKGASLEKILENESARETYNNAQQLLKEVIIDGSINVNYAIEILNAHKEQNSIVFGNGTTMPIQRSLSAKDNFISLVDYLPAAREIPVGIFCVTAKDTHHHCDCKSYNHLMRQALCARLAEAATAWLHETIYNDVNSMRPAFGYPMCPDHSLKRTAFDILNAETRLGVSLTESYAINPSTSTCGLFVIKG